MNQLSQFMCQRRNSIGFAQENLSFKAGVELRFIRELEQGSPSLRMDKVNQALSLFSHELGPIRAERDEESKGLHVRKSM